MPSDGASSVEDARIRLSRPPPADGRTTEAKFRDLLPLARRARITRIGDITNLDVIGLPVVQAIRPGSLSETTSLGRGADLFQAAIGAVMESLERHFSEHVPDEAAFSASADGLGVPEGWFEGLLARAAPDWRRGTMSWVAAIDAAGGGVGHVPLELVDTRYTQRPGDADGIFARTTTGLACHFDLRAALLHGLYECIERDAVARAFEVHGFFERNRLDPASIDGVALQDMLRLCDGFGLAVALWRVPSPTGLPVVWCQVIETGAFEPIVVLPTEGYAASGDWGAAALAALREALVTRAGVVSGGREDQFRSHYDVAWNAPAAEAARTLIRDQAFSFAPSGPAAAPAPEDELEWVLGRVEAAGLGPVLFVPVGRDPESGVECVRVVLPAAVMRTFER